MDDTSLMPCVDFELFLFKGIILILYYSSNNVQSVALLSLEIWLFEKPILNMQLYETCIVPDNVQISVNFLKDRYKYIFIQKLLLH